MGDISLLDDNRDVGAKNIRQLAALYCGANAGFEVYGALFGCLLLQVITCAVFTPIIT